MPPESQRRQEEEEEDDDLGEEERLRHPRAPHSQHQVAVNTLTLSSANTQAAVC